MKKLSILIAGLFIASTVFTSCSKDEENGATQTIGKATIEGIVFMDYDDNANVPNAIVKFEFAPAGSQVMLKIDADDLVQDPTNNVNYAEKTYYTTVGANGAYSFSIDAGVKNVAGTLTLVDVYQERTRYVANFTTTPTSYDPVKETRTYWSATPVNVNFVQNDIKIVDLEYDMHTFIQD